MGCGDRAASAAQPVGGLPQTIPAGAWTTTTRLDFAAWSTRGARAGDTALLRRAARAWADPDAKVTVALGPGTAPGPPLGPPRRPGPCSAPVHRSMRGSHAGFVRTNVSLSPSVQSNVSAFPLPLTTALPRAVIPGQFNVTLAVADKVPEHFVEPAVSATALPSTVSTPSAPSGRRTGTYQVPWKAAPAPPPGAVVRGFVVVGRDDGAPPAPDDEDGLGLPLAAGVGSRVPGDGVGATVSGLAAADADAALGAGVPDAFAPPLLPSEQPAAAIAASTAAATDTPRRTRMAVVQLPPVRFPAVRVPAERAMVVTRITASTNRPRTARPRTSRPV
ncbi:hypothetical protein [Embleya sp. NBC_00896]|uniref:hypothetical protein n=1 Tax=Embleya sp. NBC_00896 TaxID=2975961 RepID=UPI00386650AF|nr:hypothetical protein OG928_02545 [Embleya sp. NBC_00896]